MIKLILQFIQPLSCIVFIISGILSLCIGKSHQGAINLAIAFTNFIIFYGNRFLK